jgi:hypothetical protein
MGLVDDVVGTGLHGLHRAFDVLLIAERESGDAVAE